MRGKSQATMREWISEMLMITPGPPVDVSNVTVCDSVTARDRACDRRVEGVFDEEDLTYYCCHCQMASPFDLQEELQALQQTGDYQIEHEHDISSMQPGEMDDLLRRAPSLVFAWQGDIRSHLTEAVSAIAESSEAVTSPDTVDILRSFLKHAAAVPGILMSKLLDVIMSGFAAEVDAAAHDIDHEDQQTCAARKVPIEMYAFLLNWAARSGEKVQVPDDDAPATAPAKPRRGRGGKAAQPRAAAKNKAPEWSWKDQIVPVLTLISKVLKLKTSKIWTVSGERDTFIGCVASSILRIRIPHKALRGMIGVSPRPRTISRRTNST